MSKRWQSVFRRMTPEQQEMAIKRVEASKAALRKTRIPVVTSAPGRRKRAYYKRTTISAPAQELAIQRSRERYYEKLARQHRKATRSIKGEAPGEYIWRRKEADPTRAAAKSVPTPSRPVAVQPSVPEQVTNARTVGKKVAIGALGTLAAAGAAYGAYRLWRRYRDRRKQESIEEALSEMRAIALMEYDYKFEDNDDFLSYLLDAVDEYEDDALVEDLNYLLDDNNDEEKKKKKPEGQVKKAARTFAYGQVEKGAHPAEHPGFVGGAGHAAGTVLVTKGIETALKKKHRKAMGHVLKKHGPYVAGALAAAAGLRHAYKKLKARREKKKAEERD